MQLSAIMTRNPRTLPMDASPDDALELMDDQDIRHLPIMDGARLAGIISDRDLFSVLGWVPAAADKAHRRRKRPGAQTVGDLMRRQATTMGPKEPVSNACAEMVLQRIGCVPVIQDGLLVGIVTEMDVLAAYHQACTRSAADATDEDQPDQSIESLMTICSTVVEPDTTLREASELCHDLKSRHLPVLSDGRLVGLLSDRDLRAAAGSGQPAETPVERIMSSQLITLAPDARSSRAAALMIENRISAIPVVLDEALVGLLTTTDLIDHAAEVLQAPRRHPATR
jgi:CBS domain-containing protein